MRYLRAALARIAGLFTGHRADDDLRDELQAHLEMETAENIRRGMHPDAARRQALLASGGLTAGRRGGPRSARTALAREHRRRHQVRAPRAAPQPRVHRRRRHHAGARHRRQHRDLQRRPRRAAQAAAAPRRRPAGLPAAVDGRAGRSEHRLLRARGHATSATGAKSLGGIAEYSPWHAARCRATTTPCASTSGSSPATTSR